MLFVREKYQIVKVGRVSTQTLQPNMMLLATVSLIGCAKYSTPLLVILKKVQDFVNCKLLRVVEFVPVVLAELAELSLYCISEHFSGQLLHVFRRAYPS